MDGPRTYNNKILDEKSRAVFMLAMTMLEEDLNKKRADTSAGFSSEKLHAIAAVADAAAGGFESEEETY